MKRVEKRVKNTWFGLHKLKHTTTYLAIGLGLLVFVTVVAKNALRSPYAHPELSRIKATTDIGLQSKEYLMLIERVGPEAAQDLLWNSGIARTGNTHLVNHAVGDYLYEKEGPAGIVKCQNYFSSSCYHGIVIHTVGGGSLDKMDELMGACSKAGYAAAGKCSHALGHGFVAAVGAKNLFKALEMCDSVTDRNIQGYEASKCFVGAFMENIWGVHEGRPSADRLVKMDDQYYPCTDVRMQDRYQNACWFNQAFQMNKVFRGDRPKVARECIKVQQTRKKDACLDGVFRSLSSATGDDVDEKFARCELMPPDYIHKCLTTNAQAAYQQGDVKTPTRICQRIDETVQDLCYERLYRIMHEESSLDEMQKNCRKFFPTVRREECLEAVNT